jgi:hypothetical protein
LRTVLEGMGGQTYNISPTFNLGQAPATFDGEGYLHRVKDEMIKLLAETYTIGKVGRR